MKEKNRSFGGPNPGAESEAAQDHVFSFENIMHEFTREPETPAQSAPAIAPEELAEMAPPKSSAPAETGRFDFLGLMKQVQEQDTEAGAPLPAQAEAGQSEEVPLPEPPAPAADPSFEDWDALLPSQTAEPEPAENWAESLDWSQAAAPAPVPEPVQAPPDPEPVSPAPVKEEPLKSARQPHPARKPDPRLEKWAQELSFSQKMPAVPGHVPGAPREDSIPAEQPQAAPAQAASPVPQDTLTSLFGDDPVMQYWLRSEEPAPAPKGQDKAAPAPGKPVTDDTLTGLLRDIRAEIGAEPEPSPEQVQEEAPASPAQEPEQSFRSRWGKRWQRQSEPEEPEQAEQEPIRYRMPATIPMKPEVPAKNETPAPVVPKNEPEKEPENDWKDDTFRFPELDDTAPPEDTAPIVPAPDRDSAEAASPLDVPAPEVREEAAQAELSAEAGEDELMSRIDRLLQNAPAEAPDPDATIRFKAPVPEASPTIDAPTMRFDAISEPEPPVRRRVRRPAPEAEEEEEEEIVRNPRRQAPPLSAEQRYREASNGLGSALTRIFISLGAAVIALALSIAQSAGWIKLSGGVSFPPFVELALLLVCALMAFDVLADGLGQLAGKHFTLNTLAVFATILSIIDGISGLVNGTGTYCPLACLLLLSAQWGSYLNRRVQASTMDVARRSEQGEALAREYAVLGKRPGVLRGEWDKQKFLAANEVLPLPERILRWYAAAVPVVSLVCALAFGGGKAQTVLHDWTAIVLAGTPVLLFVTVWRPWSILARQLQSCGAALAGWQGVELLCGKLAFPITDEDLFPGSKLKMNGVKYFGDCPPETALSYAASVILASGSGLSGVFETQLSARNGRKYPVSNLKSYDAGGVSGEIGMDSVLVGSLRFMHSMGVDMPRGTRVSQAVYVAVNGELAGVFAISYGVTRAAALTLGALTRCKGVTPVMATRDFMLTQVFLRAKFRVDTSAISFPPMASRTELSQRRASADAPQAVLLTQEGFVPAASAVIGARSLHRCTLLGVLAVVFSGVAGMIIATVLAALGATALLCVGNLLKYMALWAVPCFLLSMWTKFN